MIRFEGGCHCGSLAYVFVASAPLDELGLRACQCSFCRAHGARNTSDPHGAMEIVAREPVHLVRYRFGLRTADFLICANCGCYIGAHLPDANGGWMTVNVNTFAEPPPSDAPLVPHNFDAEDTPDRIARRKARWTPARLFRA
jgi:hypothetical protein